MPDITVSASRREVAAMYCSVNALIFATIATLMFVPVVFSMVHKKHGAKAAAAPEMPHAH
jgi:hypothetical protein